MSLDSIRDWFRRQLEAEQAKRGTLPQSPAERKLNKLAERNNELIARQRELEADLAETDDPRLGEAIRRRLDRTGEDLGAVGVAIHDTPGWSSHPDLQRRPPKRR